MKCPLTYIIHTGNIDPEVSPMAECLKEECAWWDEVPKHCLVFSIRAELYILNELIQKRWERK